MSNKRGFLADWPMIPAAAGMLLIAAGHKSAFVFKVGIGFLEPYLISLAACWVLLPLSWLFAGRFVGDRISLRGASQMLFVGFLASPVLAFLLMMVAKGAGAILSHPLQGSLRSSCYDLVDTDGRQSFRLRSHEPGEGRELDFRISSMSFVMWNVSEGEPVRLRWKSTPVGDRLLELRPDPACARPR